LPTRVGSFRPSPHLASTSLLPSSFSLSLLARLMNRLSTLLGQYTDRNSHYPHSSFISGSRQLSIGAGRLQARSSENSVVPGRAAGLVRAPDLYCLHHPAMQKTGVVLLCLTFLLLLYTSLAAPAYAHAHTQLDPALVGQYAGPWPVALASS